MDNNYHIVVGDKRPETVRVGIIERNSGFTILKEDKGETLARRGDVFFPNKCQIWAARAIDGKIEIDGRAVEVTDAKYSGELLPMKWHQKGGTLIEARFLKGYNSLDVLFQENRLNFRIDDNQPSSADAYFLTFPNGDSDFNSEADKLLVQHLKWHPYNFNSVSKDPEFFTTMFREKSFEQEATLQTFMLDEKFEAGRVVREAGTGANSIGKCKNLFAIVKEAKDEDKEDSQLYAHLKTIADTRPSDFLKAIESYKVKISNVFEKLKSYEAADWTVDGTLVAGDKKKEIIISDLPTKGDGIFDYLLENYTDPTVFEATYKLIKITDKLK